MHGEEFLDPILGTIMNDPVILPNSQVTLDRTSIVRHLLRYVFTMIFTLIIFLLCSTVCSDASDPPLTMDQVVPNVELKEHRGMLTIAEQCVDFLVCGRK